MKKIFGLLAVSAILFTSCGKDDPEPTTAEKLQAKWNANSLVYTDFTTNPPTVATTNLTNTTIDFRSNGKVYFQGAFGVDSSTYTVLNDKYLFSDGDSLEILTLNSSVLQFRTFYRNASGVIEEDEKFNCTK